VEKEKRRTLSLLFLKWFKSCWRTWDEPQSISEHFRGKHTHTHTPGHLSRSYESLPHKPIPSIFSKLALTSPVSRGGEGTLPNCACLIWSQKGGAWYTGSSTYVIDWISKLYSLHASNTLRNEIMRQHPFRKDLNCHKIGVMKCVQLHLDSTSLDIYFLWIINQIHTSHFLPFVSLFIVSSDFQIRFWPLNANNLPPTKFFQRGSK
jgi:hypothetical protein